MTRIFQTQFNIDLIIDLCCQKAKVKREEFMMRNRRGDIILARQVAIKIFMDNMLMTYTSVASTIGNRRYDHTSIMHHHRTVNELLSVRDERLTTLYTEVLNELKDSVKTPNNFMVHISDDEATVHRVTDFLKKEKNVFYEVLSASKPIPTLLAMRSNSIPTNYIMQHHPDAHWSMHLIGHYMDAILSEKVTMKVLRHSVIKQLLYEKYVTLCNRKKIVPIEALPQHQKTELWDEAKTIGADQQDCIKIAKCIYTLHDIAETLYSK